MIYCKKEESDRAFFTKKAKRTSFLRIKNTQNPFNGKYKEGKMQRVQMKNGKIMCMTKKTHSLSEFGFVFFVQNNG